MTIDRDRDRVVRIAGSGLSRSDRLDKLGLRLLDRLKFGRVVVQHPAGRDVEGDLLSLRDHLDQRPLDYVADG
jgi:hypothetical protein